MSLRGWLGGLLVLVCVGLPAGAMTQTLTDREILEALYDATGGDGWTNNTNWKDDNEALGDWYGVTTDSSGRVVTLNLAGNNLSGSLPAALGNLSNLQFLHLSANELSGSIPAELGDLSNIRGLHLYDNALSGSIPAELGGLSNLTDLNLYDNALSGSIPAELGNLRNLQILGLDDNELSGSISAALGNLRNLRKLYLNSNALSGSIPAALGNLSELTTLLLSSNALSGSIPAALGNLSELTTLLLSSNALSGSIPAELGDLSNLDYLHLHNNTTLSGPLPRSFSAILPGLRALLIHNTQVTVSTELATQIQQAGLFFTSATHAGGSSIPLTAANTAPRGLWSDGTTLWVADFRAHKVFAYTLATGQPDADKDIPLAAANTDPRGLWSDGTTLWVADSADAHLYAYTLADGTPVSTRDIALSDAQHANPRGLWANETILWVAHAAVDIHAYTLATGQPNPARDIRTSGHTNSYGIYSDGTTLWVADILSNVLYAYTLADGTPAPRRYQILSPDNSRPRGMWSDGTRLYVADTKEGKVFIYPNRAPVANADSATTQRGMAVTIDVLANDTDADGDLLSITAITQPMNGTAATADNQITYTPQANYLGTDTFTYTISDGLVTTATGTVTVDVVDTTLSALSISPGTLSPAFAKSTTRYTATVAYTASQLTITATATDSSNATIQYLDGTDAALTDADMSTDGFQVPLAVGANEIKVQVTAQDMTTTRTYTLTVTRQPPSSDATLSALSISPGTLSPAFAKSTTRYTATVAYTASQLTITATATDSSNATIQYLDGTDAALTDADMSTDGFQVPLAVGANEIKVQVTAQDMTTTRTYTLTVTRQPPPNDALTPRAREPQAAFPATDAVYTVTFEGEWTTTATPDGVPTGAHFSPLIGGVHNAAVTFLAAGGEASAGVESMAEDGGTTALSTEITAAINASPPTALSVLSRSGTITPTAMATLNDVTVTTAYPRVTLLSMIAPSPDWFVGVAGLSLLDDEGQWRVSHSVDLYPWDAGTEDGSGFSLDNAATDPQGVITNLRGQGKFSASRIALLTFNRQSITATRSMAENTAAGVAIGAPVAARNDSGFTYALSGTDADAFDIVTTSGQLRTKSGVSYDYETKTSYTVTVTATDPGADPGVTTDDVETAITVTIRVTNVDETGTASLSSSAPRIGTALTATLSDPDGDTTDVTWQWHRSTTGTGGWSQISGETTARYTPGTADVNHYLRATARYTDGQGPNKTAQGRTTTRVPSTDATLRAIRVNGTAIVGFAPATTSYLVSLASTTTQATLSVTAAAGASVAYSGAGTDVSGGRRVTFSATENRFTITITVTAADTTTTRTYTVTVHRGVSTPLNWKVDDDLVLPPANSAPTGLWSDDSTIWVADATAARLYAYTLATGARQSGRDVTALSTAGNTDPYGLWADGETLWVVDTTDTKLYAYTLASRAHNEDEDIDLASANAAPTGVWSDGETLWVADADAARLYAYSLATRTRANSSEDITLATANAAPTGVWADGVTLWVADSDDNRLYAYSLANGNRDTAKDVTALADAGNTSPTGLWADGETLWVADRATARLYSYNLPVSNNADLCRIRVNGTVLPVTAAAIAHTVANDVARVTVVPEVCQLKATAAITSPADAAGTTGHQVDLGAGANAVAITVTAQDGTTTRDYTLTVTRTNSAPAFPSSETGARSVAENTAAGVAIGVPVAATDADGNPLRYTLGGTDDRAFTLDMTSGQLRTQAALNYETKRSYEVTVTATDSLNTTATMTVTITITDVNEPATFATTTTTRTLAENTAAGQAIGAPVAASDPEMAGLNYTLAGTDVGAFTLDTTSGQLRTRSGVSYDYETKRRYTVTVLATDGAQETAAQITVTVTITDVNEAGTLSLSSAAPQALSPLTATLTDPDRDGGSVVWKWERSANSTGPWTTISGATAASYPPQDADVNHYLRATATYTDRHHTTATPTPPVSQVSGPVRAAPVVTLRLSEPSIAEDGGESTVTAVLTGGTTSTNDTVITLVPQAGVFTLSGTQLTIPKGETASSGSGVTLTAVDNDVDADDNTVDVTGTTPNPQVTGPAAATLTIEDDDTRGVTVSETALTVREGDTTGQTYTVVLTSAPTAPVTVTVAKTAGSSADVSASPTSLTFSATTWKTPKIVTVKAVHDNDAVADTATLTHTVSGGDYGENGVTAASVDVTVEDDEADSTAVDLTVNPTTVRENASTTTVTVTGTLNGRVLTDDLAVTLAVTSGGATLDTDFTVASVGTLTITAGQKSGTATFRLTPTEDEIDEPDETVTVGGSTASLDVRGTTLTITDNDATPRVTLVLSEPSIEEDGGGDHHYGHAESSVER